MSLRIRILLLVVLAIAPAFVLLMFDHQQSLRLKEAEAEQEALRSTRLISAELEQLFKGVESLLRTAGQTPMVMKFEKESCSDYLARLEKLNPNAGLIIAADARGVVRCGSSLVDQVVTDRNYFYEALKTNDLVVGAYTIGRGSGQAILPLAIRIETADGTGVLVAGLRLDWIRKHFAGRFEQLPRDSSLTIVDRNGLILVRLPNVDREGQPLVNYSHVVNAPQPGTFRSTADKNADGVARFLGFTPLTAPPRGVAIAVGYTQESALAEVRVAALRNYTLLTAVAILALSAAAFGGQIFINRPLVELLSTIERWRNGDLKARALRRSRRTEFDRLGEAFNSMADELEAALHHKDVLLRELSHRVMNSLQTISALFRLQSKSIHDPSALAQFEQAITRVDAVALTYRRMQSIDGVESIEFAAYLSELCGNLENSLMNARCVVRAVPLQLSPKQAISLSLIVNELVTNAVKHGEKCDEPVAIELTHVAGQYRLCVKSRGDLPDGYAVRERGFGMKMIKSMVDELSGTLEVMNENHTTSFVVSFSPSVPSSAGPLNHSETGPS